MLQVVFGGVGAIALLVAAIGIANTMAMAILERTREIGLMKAVGATNRHVLSVFLGESAGIGFLGGLGGVALGWGLAQVLNVFAIAYLAAQAAQTGGPPPHGCRGHACLAAPLCSDFCHDHWSAFRSLPRVASRHLIPYCRPQIRIAPVLCIYENLLNGIGANSSMPYNSACYNLWAGNHVSTKLAKR
ncbi:MAG: ABC transporter permease [Chloroflexi bacterium]|nr:ABC transporter permease [Chloroflexota bacterium]